MKMPERIQEIAIPVGAYVGSSITFSAWIVNSLGQYHDAITAICAIIGAVIAISSFVMQIRQARKKARKNGR
jgi:uncharacterized membrane protein YeaQ/YmgE (transglycosylase-associated protein family)